MASLSGVSSSNYTSSLYNSANIVSGLASGMDTEGMIESLVQSYSTKITQLNQKATKIQWKQEGYQSIIAKMYAFSNKYASYTSSNNLSSPSFFNSARLVEAIGANKDKVSASGKSDSDVVLNGVSQLATAARYVTNGNLAGSGDGTTITASEGVDLNADIQVGTLKGSLSLTYGSKNISISFDENADQYESASQLAAAIQKKLEDQTITFSGGTSAKASDRIGVSVSADGAISFRDKSGAGNSVYISGASGTVGEALNLGDLSSASTDKPNTIKAGSSANFTKMVNTAEYLSGKGFNINLDGTTKTVYAPKIEKNEDGTYTFTMPTTVKDKDGGSRTTYEGGKKYENVSKDEVADMYAKLVGEGVNKAFGDKVTVSNAGQTNYDNGKELKLEFKTKDGSNLLINTDAGDVLKTGKSATSYLNTNKTLGDLLGVNDDGTLKGEGLVQELDEEGNGTGKYAFTLNGVKIGSYDKDTKLSEIMSDINADKDANVKVTYSRTTRSFVFESRETGSESKVDLGEGLAQSMFGRGSTDVDKSQKTRDFLGLGENEALQGKTFSVEFENGKKSSFQFSSDTGTVQQFLDRVSATSGMKASFSSNGSLVLTDDSGKTYGVKSYGENDTIGQRINAALDKAAGVSYTAGQDAKFKVTVNGIEKEMTRGSNSVDIDGMTINFNDTFDEADGGSVSFKTTTDSDKIVDAIRSMITDYNDMMSEIKSAYSTLPYQNSSGAFQSYEPLTDEDRATMSESSIEAYEKKAKQGILFGDSNLKSLYERMYNVFNPSGSDSALLRKIGITYSYSSDGTSSLSLDESKLRDALDSDPDSVMNLFTKTSETGGTSGIMEGLKTQLDRYGATTGAVKGILVQQSGTPLSSLSLLDNAWQKEIDNLGTQIEKWQDKLSDRVDYYTNMFSRLEVLINQMNSQSSTLASMMGG